MRDLANKERIFEFMNRFGRAARSSVRVYLTGGSTAVLFGWRDSTLDIDLRFLPETDELFSAIPKLKEDLRINVELAAPCDFVPLLPGWEERSVYIDTVGKVNFYHYDPYSQALAKIERGHAQDRTDVEAMFSAGLVDRKKLFELFQVIVPQLYKYPAINPESFETAVRKATGSL